MTSLNGYLAQKREAILARRARFQSGDAAAVALKASAIAEGRSGIRRIKIREFQVISDSPSDFAGYDLGPSSPEILLGALSSCLTHSYLIHAADQGVSMDDVKAEVTASIDPRGGTKGNESIPVYPHAISYKVDLMSSATSDEIALVTAAVEKFCPILNLLKRGNEITGSVTHRQARS